MSLPPRRMRPEARAPSLVAYGIALAAYGVLPPAFHPNQRFTVLAVLVVALLLLVAVAPVRLTRRPAWWRVLSLVTAWGLAFAWLLALVQWVALTVTTVPDNGPRLLVAALQIWLVGTLAFALLFWELDRGGAVARRKGRPGPSTADFRFPQEEPRLGWMPSFVDYLSLSVSNSTAFARTRIPALSGRAKLLLALESFASFVLLGVVVARAVVLFG